MPTCSSLRRFVALGQSYGNTSAVPRKRAVSRLALRPHLVEHEVAIDGLPEALDGLRIAHLTDVHCGKITPAAHIRAAIDLSNSARPDLVVMTGDYVCWHKEEVELLRQQMGGIEAKQVVCTLGNHDYFADGEGVAQALTDLGYRVLRNESHSVEHGSHTIDVIGVDDPITRKDDIEQSFKGSGQGGVKIALCHCPEKADELAERGAHLIFSGHTHGGQINVKGITDRIFKRAGRRYYYKGLYSIGEAQLYVSSGVGFSGVRVRAGIGTRAEVGLFTLRATA